MPIKVIRRRQASSSVTASASRFAQLTHDPRTRAHHGRCLLVADAIRRPVQLQRTAGAVQIYCCCGDTAAPAPPPHPPRTPPGAGLDGRRRGRGAESAAAGHSDPSALDKRRVPNAPEISPPDPLLTPSPSPERGEGLPAGRPRNVRPCVPCPPPPPATAAAADTAATATSGDTRGAAGQGRID